RAARKTPVVSPAPGHGQWNPALAAATVAVSASCSFSALKELGWMAIPGDEEMIAILSDRRPEGCDAYAEYLLDRGDPRWKAVRAMMKVGLCRKPTHDNYVIGMLAHYIGVGVSRSREGPTGNPQEYEDVLEHLLEEPDLLDDVWRLFELE